MAKFHKSGLMLTKMRIPNFKDKYHVIWFPWREILTLIVSILTKFIKLNMRPNFLSSSGLIILAGLTKESWQEPGSNVTFAAAVDRAYMSEQPVWLPSKLPAGQDPHQGWCSSFWPLWCSLIQLAPDTASLNGNN